jgi:hypothetical protein
MKIGKLYKFLSSEPWDWVDLKKNDIMMIVEITYDGTYVFVADIITPLGQKKELLCAKMVFETIFEQI